MNTKYQLKVDNDKKSICTIHLNISIIESSSIASIVYARFCSLLDFY